MRRSTDSTQSLSKFFERFYTDKKINYNIQVELVKTMVSNSLKNIPQTKDSLFNKWYLKSCI